MNDFLCSVEGCLDISVSNAILPYGYSVPKSLIVFYDVANAGAATNKMQMHMDIVHRSAWGSLDISVCIPYGDRMVSHDYCFDVHAHV